MDWGDAYTSVAIAKKVGTGSWTVYNIFRDHLGTITHLKTGSTVAEYSFDAWGRRRDKDDWTTTLTSEPTLFVDRGFTGHEYLEDFKLYNMNGRLYDPVVGRFLSADPYIQDPGFTQNLNRYSYCLNNPLKFNDPSGENPFLIALGILWAGNYLIGLLDNTINKKMSLNEAFRNPNFIAGVNFSPSNMTRQNNFGFSNERVDAQMAAWREEDVSQQLDKFINGMSGADHEKNIFKNFHVSGQADWKITAGVQAGGNTGGIGGTYGLFANLCSITLLGNEGGNRIYPGSRSLGYTQINQGLSGGFYLGAGVSHTFDGSFEGYGSTNETITYQGLAGNKAGSAGITYQYDSLTGIHSMNIGWVPQYAFFLGFEGVFDLKISW